MDNIRIRDFTSDFRPDKWGEICGQPTSVARLKHYCVTARPPKAVLFAGTYGTGKSTLARLLSMSMACEDRQDDDPDPCGHCESCQDFSGKFCSRNTVIIPPQTSIDVFKTTLCWAQNSQSASMWNEEARRPMPIFLDDLDENPKPHQKFLKRLLDEKFKGFIVSASTESDKIDKGLLARFHVFSLQPPEMSDLIPWIQQIGRRGGIGKISPDAAAMIARSGGMNHRDILKLIQSVQSSDVGFTVEGVEKAALMAGLQ